MKANYAGLALVFAEAADRLPPWRKALERWNLKESTLVNDWIAQGEMKGIILSLLEVLEARFGKVPPDISKAIRETPLPFILQHWIGEAAKAATLDDFRKAAGL